MKVKTLIRFKDLEKDTIREVGEKEARTGSTTPVSWVIIWQSTQETLQKLDIQQHSISSCLKMAQRAGHIILIK